MWFASVMVPGGPGKIADNDESAKPNARGARGGNSLACWDMKLRRPPVFPVPDLHANIWRMLIRRKTISSK